MKRDLTQGNILKNVIIFSLPFLLSYFLQILYGMADLFIIGQYNGADVITAVSVGSQITYMLTVVIVGLAMGSLVLIGRSVGANNQKQISKIIGNAISFFTIFGVSLVLSVNNIVHIMSTPLESYNQTSAYLLICFIGIPFIIAYNLIGSIFRGMDDSKSPMYFILIACIINILLDYLFIGYFHIRAIGVALGTIIAQAINVLISFAAIKRKNIIRIKRNDLFFNKKIIKEILVIGVPVALQDGFIQISFLVIMIIANKRGVEVAAAVGIVEKIISFLFIIPSTMMSAVSTISSQSIGAGKKELARKVLFIGIGIAAGIGFVFALSLQFVSEYVIGLFTSEKQVIILGT